MSTLCWQVSQEIVWSYFYAIIANITHKYCTFLHVWWLCIIYSLNKADFHDFVTTCTVVSRLVFCVTPRKSCVFVHLVFTYRLGLHVYHKTRVWMVNTCKWYNISIWYYSAKSYMNPRCCVCVPPLRPMWSYFFVFSMDVATWNFTTTVQNQFSATRHYTWDRENARTKIFPGEKMLLIMLSHARPDDTLIVVILGDLPISRKIVILPIDIVPT